MKNQKKFFFVSQFIETANGKIKRKETAATIWSNKLS
jgi:hypothetical protein